MILPAPKWDTKYTANLLFVSFFCISILFVFAPISPFVEYAPKIVHFFFNNYPFLRMVSQNHFQQYAYVAILAIQWLGAYVCFWVFMSFPALFLTVVSLKFLKLMGNAKPLVDLYLNAFLLVLLATLIPLSIAAFYS